MDELIRLTNFCQFTVEQQADCMLTKVTSSHELKVSYVNRGCCYQDKAYLVMDGIESFSTIYLVVNCVGQIEEVLLDKEGLLPTLFSTADTALWVRLTVYDPDKDMEVILPLFNRSLLQPSKIPHTAAMDFVGVNKMAAYFYENGYSPKQLAKAQIITLQKEALIKKKMLKVPLPNNNKVYVNDEGLHLLTKEEQILLHRIVDIEGNIADERKIVVNQLSYLFEVINMRFNGDSRLITFTAEGAFYLIDIDSQGSVAHHLLAETRLDIFSIWPPVFLSEQTYLIQFTYAEGNGWLLIKDQQLMELYVGKGNIYTDQITNQQLTIACVKPVITSVCRTVENGYCIGLWDKEQQVLYLLSKILRCC